jgi:perosamine synthetase
VIRAVDIDPATLAPAPEAVAAAVTPDTRLIVIAHLFGSLVDLGPFASLKREGLLLVEDCAQGWRPGFTGSPEADVSLFSFGPIKTLTALGGAVAAFRDGDLARRFGERLASYPALGRMWFARRVLKYAALKALSNPLAYGGVCRIVKALGGDIDAAIARLTRGFGEAPDVARFRARPPAAMLRLLARRLASRHDLTDRAARAKELVAARPEAPGGMARDITYWVTPILVDDPAAARRMLMANGFDATRGTTSMRAIGAAAGAEDMMRAILYLPSPAHLPPAELHRLRGLVAAIPPCGPPGSRPPSGP